MATTDVKVRGRAAGPVRITLPAKIAYSPEALKKSIASLAEQIGHPRCFSGADCFFQNERQFIVNPDGKVTGASQVAGPVPDPWHAAGPGPQPWRVSVSMSRAVMYDIDKVLGAVDRVIDLIGPHPCISGFDTLFRDEMETWIAVNDQLQAQRFGQPS